MDVITDHVGARSILAYILVHPDPRIFDGCEIEVSGEMPSGYMVFLEDAVMMVIHPAYGYDSRFRERIYDAIGLCLR
jgi:hypothetical protein